MECLQLHFEPTSHLRVIHSKKAQKPIKKRLHYYPFGLKHKGYNSNYSGGNASAQKKLYQGQELNENLGYNMYEFELRHYDAAIGRFVTTDPYEQFSSPYLAMGNNPVVSFDPDGGFCYDSSGNQIACPEGKEFDDYRENEDNHHTMLDEVNIDAGTTQAPSGAEGEDAMYNQFGEKLLLDQIDWSKVFADQIEANAISSSQASKEFMSHPIFQIMFAIATGGIGSGGAVTGAVTTTTRVTATTVAVSKPITRAVGAAAKGFSKKINFGKIKVSSEVFHRTIKPEILKNAGRFKHVVGKNPDIKIINGKIKLVGQGPYKGRSFNTNLNASDFFN